VALIPHCLCNRESFERAKQFHDEITQQNRTPNFAVVICGNKSDLEDQRVVSTAEGEEFASKASATFFETSALANINVENAFTTLARSAVFRFYGRTISYPASLVPTVGKARVNLAADLKLSVNEIEIRRTITEVSLPDSEPTSSGTYVVKHLGSDSLHCFLFLKPTGSVGQNRRFIRELNIEIDRDGIKTVEDLLNRHFPRSEFPVSGHLKVLKDDVELGHSTMLTNIENDSVLLIEYPAGLENAVYNFTFPGKKSKSLTIGLDETVADVKAKLLAEIGSGNVFSSVLKLRFWGIELNDGESFSGLGIPDGGEIELGWNKAKQIQVTLTDGSSRAFFVTESDRVPSLKGLLAQKIVKDAEESLRKVTSSSG
jgi:hypothetical protein